MLVLLKMCHKTIICKMCANDILKGKLREYKIVALNEDPLDTNNEEDFDE